MKKIYVILLVLAITHHGKSQQNETDLKLQTADYVKKSKKQRNTGLVLLGGGAACFGAGAYALEHARDKSGYGTFIMLGGMGMAAASLPFFISSVSNKHKAKIYINREAFMITPHHKSNILYNAISLRLNI